MNRLYGQFPQSSGTKKNNDAALKSIDHQPSGNSVLPSKTSTSFSRGQKDSEKKNSLQDRRKSSQMKINLQKDGPGRRDNSNNSR